MDSFQKRDRIPQSIKNKNIINKNTSLKDQQNNAYKRQSLISQKMENFESPGSSISLAFREYYRSTERNKQKQLRNDYYKQAKPKKSNKEVLDIHINYMNIPNAITDVDFNYFRIIQARSKHQTKIMNKHQYLTDINNSLRQNISTGYSYDEMFKIDEQFETEKLKLINIKENLSTLSGYFEQFLDDDHKDAMNLLATALREVNETEKCRAVLRKKQERLGKIRNEIYNYEEIYEKTLSCAGFILAITPDGFYEEDTKQLMNKRLSKTSDQSLEDLSNQLEIERIIPKLYFKEPWDVYQLLRDLEIQNLKLMFHTLEFKNKLKEEWDLIHLLETFSHQELRTILWKIELTEKAIRTIENRTKELEERCTKLLNEEYRDFVSGNASIMLTAYMAETYAYLMSAEPSQSPIRNLSVLETEFKNLLFHTNNIPRELFHSIRKSVNKTKKEREIKARIAERKLIDLDILVKRTLKLLDPPGVIKRRKLMTRSPLTSKPKVKQPPRPPTSEDKLLQLYLFTDTCRPQLQITEEIEKEDE